MEYVRWDDSMSVNIELIDNQHINLIMMINKLHRSLIIGQGNAAVGPVLTGLVDYVKIHFSTEEKLMKKYNYPEYDIQKQEHVQLILKLKDFLKKYKERSPLLAREILIFLGEWVRIHIKEEDAKFKPFFHKHGVK